MAPLRVFLGAQCHADGASYAAWWLLCSPGPELTIAEAHNCRSLAPDFLVECAAEGRPWPVEAAAVGSWLGAGLADRLAAHTETSLVHVAMGDLTPGAANHKAYDLALDLAARLHNFPK